jgi:hypothetical protein
MHTNQRRVEPDNPAAAEQMGEYQENSVVRFCLTEPHPHCVSAAHLREDLPGVSLSHTWVAAGTQGMEGEAQPVESGELGRRRPAGVKRGGKRLGLCAPSLLVRALVLRTVIGAL